MKKKTWNGIGPDLTPPSGALSKLAKQLSKPSLESVCAWQAEMLERARYLSEEGDYRGDNEIWTQWGEWRDDLTKGPPK